MEDNSDCPNLDCSMVLDELRSKSCNATSLYWGYSSANNVRGDYEFKTVAYLTKTSRSSVNAADEISCINTGSARFCMGIYKRRYNPLDSLPASVRSKVIKKDWKVYKCRACNMITHAMYTKSSSKNKSKLMAIVTNFKYSPTRKIE